MRSTKFELNEDDSNVNVISPRVAIILGSTGWQNKPIVYWLHICAPRKFYNWIKSKYADARKLNPIIPPFSPRPEVKVYYDAKAEEGERYRVYVNDVFISIEADTRFDVDWHTTMVIARSKTCSNCGYKLSKKERFHLSMAVIGTKR